MCAVRVVHASRDWLRWPRTSFLGGERPRRIRARARVDVGVWMDGG